MVKMWLTAEPGLRPGVASPKAAQRYLRRGGFVLRRSWGLLTQGRSKTHCKDPTRPARLSASALTRKWPQAVFEFVRRLHLRQRLVPGVRLCSPQKVSGR